MAEFLADDPEEKFLFSPPQVDPLTPGGRLTDADPLTPGGHLTDADPLTPGGLTLADPLTPGGLTPADPLTPGGLDAAGKNALTEAAAGKNALTEVAAGSDAAADDADDLFFAEQQSFLEIKAISDPEAGPVGHAEELCCRFDMLDIMSSISHDDR